ncbi:MAG: 3-dehydroquinate synthase [Deltaproteobacteria bacterium]|nr:3-dehydroquinate synthase [Deltaproteobacteria bacterium]
MKIIEVGLGNRSYPIMAAAGLLAGIGQDLRQRAIAKRYVVVADDRVAGLYGNQLMDSLAGAGLSCELLTFAHGEASKNMTTIAGLASSLARLGVDRKDCLIALGGGVTGDITGFVAAIYMRGIPFVQVPTTLLAQVDSSVGGKTGVDIPEGKNLVGVFYQPRAVYIDSRVLSSLPLAELLNGLAEVIKYGVIYDREFFDFLAANREQILALQLPVVEEVIVRCCWIKAAVVAADEKEADLRRILNYGHTLGHAVEAASQFAIAHGMAVAMGMVAANKLAMAKSLLAPQEAERISRLVADFGLPVAIPAELDRQLMKSFLKTDKKTVAGRPFFVLPTCVGKVIITDDVAEELIDQALEA